MYAPPMEDAMASRRFPARAAALWALLALVAGILFAHSALPNIAPASDVWDYCQESRQIVRGEGFTSLYTYPVFLGSVGPPFPVLWRIPLYAALGALLLRLGVALPAGFLYLGAFAHALLVGLTYRLAAKLHSARAAAWAAACALACPLLLDAHNPGLSQVPAAVLDISVWLILLGSRGRVAAALAAVPAAAAWYLRGESLLFVPLWLWMASRPMDSVRSRSSEGVPAPPNADRWNRRRLWPALAFVAVYAALCLPWLLAVQRARAGFAIQGNPMLLYTPEYPGYSSSRTLDAQLPGVFDYVLRHMPSFAWRYAKDFAGYALDFLTGLGPLAIGLALAGAAARGWKLRIDWRSPVAPLALAIAWQVLALSGLERSPRFLVPVVPIACVLLGIAAAPALNRMTTRRLLAVAFLALLLERGARVVYELADARRRSPPIGEATAATLAELTREWPRDGLVLTDVPDWVAWRLDRPALFSPLLHQVGSLAESRGVSGIWLSPGARLRNVADGDSAWVAAIDRNARLPGFTGPEILADGSRLYARAAPPGK